MSLGDEIADLLTHRALVLRPLPAVVSGTGETTVEYAPLADGVPCKVYSGGGNADHGEGGVRIIASPQALFLLSGPVETEDRLVVDGITYLVTFARVVHDNDGPSHRQLTLARVAVPPYLDQAPLGLAAPVALETASGRALDVRVPIEAS